MVGRQRDYKANGMHPASFKGNNDILAGAKYQVPVHTSDELSYWNLTFRLTKGPSNEMQKSTCITSRRQMMKALVTTEESKAIVLGGFQTMR